MTGCNVDWGSEALFASLLDPSSAFLDIGANVGYYSLYMLPKVAEVHAFEPDARAACSLLTNLAAYPNAYVYSFALSNRVGRAGFVQEMHSETSHLAVGAGTHEVKLTTIDRFVTERQIFVSGIKIDVEGADLDVLHGAEQTLKTQHPLVLTEAKPDDELFNFTQYLNYGVFAFVRRSGGVPFDRTWPQFSRAHQNAFSGPD